jgi:hypothetical protein
MRGTGAAMVAGWIGIGLALCAEPPERAAPTLVRPGPNAKTSNPYVGFSWQALPWAETYTIQIGSTRSFTPPLVTEATTRATRFRLKLPVAGSLWWRVRGVDSTGAAGAWSEARSFEYPPPPLAATVAALTLTPASVVGGIPSQGLVTLGEPAPAGGASVELTSSDPSKARGPARVIVDANALAATFAVATFQSPEAASVRISAKAKENDCAGTLTVGPPGPPSPLVSLAVNPATITGSHSGVGTLTLAAAAPAPQGALVHISSDDPTLVSVPSTVTVPAGSSTQSFPVKTAWATSTRSIAVTATLGGVTRSATLTVKQGSGLDPLAAPAPLSPPEERTAHYGYIEFAWSGVEGAASYTLQIDDAGTFQGPLVLERMVPDTRVSLTELPAVPLWWRVRANDDHGGAGTWSEPRPLR